MEQWAVEGLMGTRGLAVERGSIRPKYLACQERIIGDMGTGVD